MSTTSRNLTSELTGLHRRPAAARGRPARPGWLSTRWQSLLMVARRSSVRADALDRALDERRRADQRHNWS